MRNARSHGFTLIELLTTIAIVGILAGLLTTALTAARSKANGVSCLSNVRQLSLAFFLYASDNNERLPNNFGGPNARGVAPRSNYNWVNNLMSWELDEDNTNLTFAARGAFSPYANRTAQIYRCPSDRVLSRVQREAGWSRRVRSYSMNAMVGDAGSNSRWGTNIFNPGYRQFKKATEFHNPAGIFVFLDEHPDSVNDGYFLNRLEDFEWIDLPASYHGGGVNLTFADGHAESHRWIHPTTKPPPRPDAARLPFIVERTERADFDWVMRRTSVEYSPDAWVAADW